MDDFLTFANRLADAAGAVIRPYFGTALDVENKSDDSPVSRADREAEAAIRALIETTYPDHGIYGEEHGLSKTQQRYVWVIDPIDGTRAFLAGKKEWGTLIALCDNGVPILGVLDQPVTGERWVGAKERHATFLSRHSSESWNPSSAGSKQMDSSFRWNDKKISAAKTTSLADATISSTSARYFTPPQATAFVRLAGQCRQVIEDGDCYAYGLLASGARDLVVDAGLKPYDILALVPIIEGAGGKITHWDGAPVTLSHYAHVLAAGSAALHAQGLGYLR